MDQLSWQNLRSAILWVMALMAVLAYASFAASVETAANFNKLELVLPQDLVIHTLVALLFAFLSLVLRGNANRLTNLIAGAVFALGTLVAAIIGFMVNVRGIYNPVLLAAVVLYGSIWWFALKTPRTA